MKKELLTAKMRICYVCDEDVRKGCRREGNMVKRNAVAYVIPMLVLLMLLSGCAAISTGAAADVTGPEPVPATEIGPTYAEKLFDASYVHTIDIRITDADWEDLLANPLEKTKYTIDIVADGEVFEGVTLATKGNSSLAFVTADGGGRYSLKVNFAKGKTTQSYYGLNNLNLHNGFYDTTYMKDYISYGIFREAGVDAPLTSYVWLTVNGEDRGLYLAVEEMGKSFLARTSDGEGVIYKPESSDLGLTVEKVQAVREHGLPMAGEVHGSDLVYSDDNVESYPDIFNNAETKTTDEDNLAVINALKHLAQGTDLESCLDTDEIISFFAVHNLVLNYDSYTAGMLHNLVLFEKDGKLSMLPWDYNLSYATFVPAITNEVIENATEILNQGIDTPLFRVDEESRPMWKWIVDDESYLALYHEKLDKLLTGYFESGRFEHEARALYEMLLPYVEKDPTIFYSVDEFKTGFGTLVEFIKRRAQSIRKQLDGDLAARNEDQQPQNKVDASDLNVHLMGGPDWVF